MKSLIDKLKHTQKVFEAELPEQSMRRLAKKFVLWTTTTYPGPPVKTGRLRSSGSSFVGNKQVTGPHKHQYKVNEAANVITIAYSAPVKAGDKANMFYVFGGTKWFDYAEYQHLNHATNKLWLTVLRAKRGVEKAVKHEVRRILGSIW